MSQVSKYSRYAVKKYPAVQRRAKVYVPAVKQLASDVMYLKGLINSEPKAYTVQYSGNFNYNGVVGSLALIPQGLGSGDRDGTRILPRYLSLNCYVSITTATASTAPINCRFILFRYWGETTSAAPLVAPAEILSTVGTQFAPLSHLNEANTGSRGDRSRRIEVHRSENFLLDKVGKTHQCFNFNIAINGGNKPKEHMEYRGAATEEPVSGGFYVMFVSDNATSTEVHYKLESRLSFYDN